MAEGFLKAAIESEPELAGRFTASSAGLAAFEGDPASQNSITVLKDGWEIDICSHQARRLSYEDIMDAYLILTMTRSHKEAILSKFPDISSKVHTLKEYVSDSADSIQNEEYNFALDISDPYGMPLQVYKRCAEEIKQAVDRLVTKLKNVT